IQGDEPDIDPALVDLAVKRLQRDTECPVSTLASPFSDDEDPSDPNRVRGVVSQRGAAVCLSRALIPHDRDGHGGVSPLKHVGLYVYRREFLLKYVTLDATPPEQAAKLEQLRILQHGYSIAVAVGNAHFHGIDT